MINYEQYLRTEKLPLIWCPGCGHGIVMKALLRAVHEAQLDKDKVCMVSGIGCSSRLTGYVDFNTLHTTHGRAIAFATGIKMARPEMHVIVITGDGDASSIGGNHLIHAARRNIDLTVVLFNNQIYGMTGGQVSPTTPYNAYASTAPYGSFENNFDIPQLVEAAGASFVARGTAYHAMPLTNYIVKAIDRKGFSLVEALSPCPTTFGRRNKQGDGVKMLQRQKDHTISQRKAESMPDSELNDKIITGIFVDIQKPECREEYQKLIDHKKGKGA
ncbi:MAG: 2-oxoacid:ferredoxin oxidoreductase subunit beta [candidate division KSB1 bacterium]|nr:2-oxoacid:ferredoxin oxidoreductase subunit beta [candidate division KSB1 bacterium]